MKILIIANSESVHTARFANEFTNRGHEVLLLSATHYMGRVVKYENVKHIAFLNFITKIHCSIFKKSIKTFNPEISKPYHPFNFLILFRMIYLFFFINKVLKKEKFDAVFAINLTTNGLFAARIKNASIKIIQVLGCDVRLAKWNSSQIITNNKFVFRYVYKKINYIFSGTGKQNFLFFSNRNLFFKTDSKKIIYKNGLGVNSDLFSPDFKNDLIKKELFNLESNTILSVCFRQPRPSLDFPNILKNLIPIIEKYPHFYFAIGTGGIDFPELKKIAIDNGIEKNIIFLNNIPYDKLHLYVAQGDIYIDPINIKRHPSTLSSGISGALLESMSCGLIPVVGKRQGLEAYFSNQNMNDFFYEDMDTQLAEYIEKAIKMVNDLKIKDFFRNIVIEKSSWKNNIDLILSYYNNK